jgi:hypothetical protein
MWTFQIYSIQENVNLYVNFAVRLRGVLIN